MYFCPIKFFKLVRLKVNWKIILRENMFNITFNTLALKMSFRICNTYIKSIELDILGIVVAT